MKTVFHKSLTQELWNEKTFQYQIVTIGAEFYIHQIDNIEICFHLYSSLLKWHPSTDGVEIN